MPKRTRKLVLTLPVQFTDEQMIEKRDRAANATLEYETVEDEKRATTRVFSERLKALRGELRRLAHQVKKGGEDVPIDCCVTLDDPEKGMKTICRLDTGEVVRTEQMTQEELQEELFENQHHARVQQHEPLPEDGPAAQVEITFRYIQDVAATIAALPKHEQSAAVKDMARKLTMKLLAQGKIADKNGKEETLETPAAATELAERWLTGCLLTEADGEGAE